MKTFKIRHRHLRTVLFKAEAETLLAALEMAVKSGVNLDGANLVRASLVRANLVGASLVGASLVRASLDEANLDGANLDEANLDGASLDEANLDGASLVRASLVGASLDEANLDGASLVRASLVGANLVGANLVGASLVGASLVRASLVGANLVGAKINWQSHELIAELLRRQAGESIARRAVAGLIAVSWDKCWDWFLAHLGEMAESSWAIDALASRVVDGDGAPRVLRLRAAEMKAAAGPVVAAAEGGQS